MRAHAHVPVPKRQHGLNRLEERENMSGPAGIYPRVFGDTLEDANARCTELMERKLLIVLGKMQVESSLHTQTAHPPA